MYLSKEGTESPSQGQPQNPPKAQLTTMPRRPQVIITIYTQVEYRIPACAAKLGEQKNPTFPEVELYDANNLRRKRGIEVLHDPERNKSTAFTEAKKQYES
jgi:hypothetical protein